MLCCTLEMKVVVSKWAEISQHRDTQQGEEQMSHQGCQTCSRCALGKSQQGAELTWELPLSQAQGVEAEPNFETRH